MDKYITWYVNYRCRKCGQLLCSEEKYYIGCTAHEFASSLDDIKGKLATSKVHACPAGIQEDEFILCDLVSISKSPLKDADEVIKIKA